MEKQVIHLWTTRTSQARCMSTTKVWSVFVSSNGKVVRMKSDIFIRAGDHKQEAFLRYLSMLHTICRPKKYSPPTQFSFAF